jgi:hypothetical protein
VFMLCYFCAIALYGEPRVLLREVKDRGLQKGSDTHIFYLLFTTTLVFLVVCMIGGIFNSFTKC